MREDEDQFRYYVPLLRRIIILVAVLTAVPVILWTITAFVRSYVGPPKIPTFHQLAATEPSEASATSSPDAGSAVQSAPEPAKPSDPAAATQEVRTAAVDTREVSVSSKGSSLVDRSPDNGINLPASPAKLSDASPITSPTLKASDVLPAAGPNSTGMLTVPATPNAPPATTGTLAAQQPSAASEPPADAMPASPPLSGPIPLPRRRPHFIAAEAPMTQMAQMAQMNVPMPRPRPDSAGPAPQPETAPGPLDFLQNIFHQ